MVIYGEGEIMSESHDVEWQDQLLRFLISGGLGGREQSRIMNVLADHAYADRILHELNALRADGKVQKFNLPMKGKGTVVVWRATTEILNPRANDVVVDDDEDVDPTDTDT